MPVAAMATIPSGTQNQAGASPAPAAAQAKAPPIASTTGRVRSACVDQGVGSGVAMPRMAAQNP
jgi:hypothetical protein